VHVFARGHGVLGLRPECGQTVPVEELRPPLEVEAEFEFHVHGQVVELVLVVGRVDASQQTVRAQSHALQLVAAFDFVVWSENLALLEERLDVDSDGCPFLVGNF